MLTSVLKGFQWRNFVAATSYVKNHASCDITRFICHFNETCLTRPDQTRMRVDESCNSRSRLTANSRQLSCTLINFELVQILVRVNGSFGSFDRSWELHECRRELQKQAISKSLPRRRRRRRRRRKENIITYHRQVTVGVMPRAVSSLTSVKKRRKRSGEATSKNKEIEKRRKTLVNSHTTLSLLVWPSNESWGNTRVNSLLPTLIDSHPRLIQA